MTNYEALKAFGFSPSKAAEIDLDAKRGDKHALVIVELATVKALASKWELKNDSV